LGDFLIAKTTFIMSNHSKKYKANLLKIQSLSKGRDILDISTAVDLLFQLDQPNFKNGPTVEIHFKLNINPTKSDQLIRSSVVLPNGTGKEIKIAAFVSDAKIDLVKKLGVYRAGNEDLIEEIKKTSIVDFDIAIAETEIMKKLAPIARILGTKGVMPNPKMGTVGDDIESMVNSIKAGKVDFKNDKLGNLHIACGKINPTFTPEKIVQNIEAVVEAVKKVKPDVIKRKYITTAHITSTFSPSIRII
jgi:large subunit ribosomal protein L1